MHWQQRFNNKHINYLASFVAGLLYPLAFAPLSFYPLAFVSVAIVFFLWSRLTPKQTFVSGWFFGMGLFGLGVSWIFVAIHVFGNTPAAVAAFMVFLFVAFVSLVIAIQVMLYNKYFINRGNILTQVLAFSSLWLIFEWLRGWILNGFPWLNLGASQTDTVLVNWAPMLGVYGVTWLVVVVSCVLLITLTTASQSQRLKSITSIVVVFVASYGLGFIEWSKPVGKPITVSMVQGNAPQITKWDPDKIQLRLDTYARLTRQSYASDLIIWPENSLTTLYHQVAESYLDPIGKEARENNTDLIVGLPYMNLETRRYYSSFLSYSDRPGVYHKKHLVPFGEFMPLESLLRGLVGFFDLPMSSFSHGDPDQPLLHAAGQPLAASICFEDAFGAELIRQLPEATLLINGSNNAWYGNSFAPHQHLQISRMRAIETSRMMMRATTNGISAFIDHKGRVFNQSKQFTTMVLTDKVQPHEGATLYVRMGNYPIVIFCCLLLVAIVIRQQKQT